MPESADQMMTYLSRSLCCWLLSALYISVAAESVAPAWSAFKAASSVRLARSPHPPDGWGSTGPTRAVNWY
jgi:hypothetical protein